MVESVQLALEILAKLLEIVGAVVLILGFIIGTVHWFRESLSEKKEGAAESYRRTLGRVILIGLELLVAATIIIKTITLKPTMEGAGRQCQTKLA